MSVIEVAEGAINFVLNSDCQCFDCNKCGMGYINAEYEQKCDDCTEGVLKHSNTCMGCWDDSKEDFYQAIYEWRKEVGVDWNLVRIDGSAMGWTRSKGSAVVPMERALDALTIRGDFRIEVKLKGKELSARRYSHDEPTGASFFFTLVKGEED